MCLGIPGKIVNLYVKNQTKMGLVDFNGIELDVCLEAVPDTKLNDYVIVHAGFAISTLSEPEAMETLEMLQEIDALNQQESNG